MLIKIRELAEIIMIFDARTLAEPSSLATWLTHS